MMGFLTGYNMYQNKLLCDIKGDVLIGENTFELIASDQANNINKVGGTFYIEDK